MDTVEVIGIDCRTIVLQKSLVFTSWKVKNNTNTIRTENDKVFFLCFVENITKF